MCVRTVLVDTPRAAAMYRRSAPLASSSSSSRSRAVKGSYCPGHAGDARLRQHVTMDSRAKPIGKQKPSLYAPGNRADRRNLTITSIAEQSRTAPIKLVTGVIFGLDLLEIAVG